MKIVVDARTMGSCPSGVGIYLFDFLQELIQKDRFDFRLVTDVATSSQMEVFREKGIPIFCYGKRVFRSAGVYSYFHFVQKILALEDPDVFWEPNNLLPIKLKHFHGKIMLTVHDLFPITKPEYYRWVYRLYFRNGIKKSLEQADAVLFNSLETQGITCQTFPAINGKPTFVSYLIIKEPPARSVLDGGFFLYIGNLEKRKGTDLLIKAYSRYCDSGGKKALCLGGKVREKEIENLLREAQQKYPKLQYLGYLEEEKKYELLSQCSCFLFPSRAEGFGIPPLEAMGYQKPVITSGLSIFKEVLPASVEMFPLEGTDEDQAENLSRLMLQQEKVTAPVTVTNSGVFFGNYRGDILGNRLAWFMDSVFKSHPSGGVK